MPRYRSAPHLQSIKIEWHGKQLTPRRINQVTARQVPRVHSSMLENDSLALVTQIHRRNPGSIEISDLRAQAEQYRLRARQDLRPTMGLLSNG